MLATSGDPGRGVSHDGILLEATGSSGARGLHNNTTLRIQRSNNRIEGFEVGSYWRLSEVARIRDTANMHAGSRIVYYREGSESGRLISVRTVAGETIVSAEHTLAVEQFTGWGIFLSGAALGLVSLILLYGWPRSPSRET